MAKIKFPALCWLLLMPLFSLYGQSFRGRGIKISANHRFFVDEKAAPFFWLGDTGWLLFSKLTREEARHYLEDRHEKGFNVIQVMLLHDLSTINVYGDSALVNKNVAHPLLTPGDAFADPAQYDYWDHIDYIVDLAAGLDMYMAMVPLWGANVKAGKVAREDAAVYAKWLADRYRNKWNIVWLNGGDVKGSDSLAIWNTIGATLHADDPNHLVTYHPFGRTSSSQWFHNEAWLDFNMFQSGHRDYGQGAKTDNPFGPDNYRFVEKDYSLKPGKPTLDGEPSYELIPYGLHDTTQPYWQAADIRRYAYWSVFAGAAGHTYGHNSVMQMHKSSDMKSAYGSKKYWTAALNDSGARQMKYLKLLMLSMPYLDRLPDQSLIAGVPGEKYNYIAAMRGRKYALLYDYTGRGFEVNMGKIEGVFVKASWYSPLNGQRVFIGRFGNTGVCRFNPPGEPREGNDWVLILETLPDKY